MTWLVILAVGIGSFVLRLGPLLLFQHRPLSDSGDRMIRHAGVATITSLIAVSTKHSATGAATMPTLITVTVVVVLAVRGASMLRLLVCGGAIYACSVALTDLLCK